jgi:nitroreductase
MAFFRARRSCRIYERRPVERTKILQLLEAGRFAPSGGNRQPLGYVVLQSPEALADARRMAMGALGERAVQIRQEAAAKLQRGERLSAAEAALQINAQMWLDMPGLLDKGDDRLFYFAPAVIVCHGDHPSASMEVDAGLAGMQMALMAEALGLGTCFCHFLVFALEQSAALRAALRVPEGRKTAFALLVGYPDVTFSRLVARNAAAVQWV